MKQSVQWNAETRKALDAYLAAHYQGDNRISPVKTTLSGTVRLQGTLSFNDMLGMENLCSADEAFQQEGPPRLRSLDEVVDQIGETFSESLLRRIDDKGLSDVAVYKKAGLSRQTFSKIRGNRDYRPSKKTALALAIALELNLDETRDLLARGELALSPGIRADVIVMYFIECKIYDLAVIDQALYDYGEEVLGA